MFRPGYLKSTKFIRTPANVSLEREVDHRSKVSMALSRQPLVEICAALFNVVTLIYHYVLTVLYNLPILPLRRRKAPFDHFYRSLVAIETFSEFSSNANVTNPLSITFEVWRPSPQWRRKSPGSPDFHVCVLDARAPFPSLYQLQTLYNSVKSTYLLEANDGRVVLAVVDKGVSNYLTLDNTIVNDNSGE